MHGLTVRCDDVALDARRAPLDSTPDLTVRVLGHGLVPAVDERPSGRVLARVEDQETIWLSVLEPTRTDAPMPHPVVDIHFHGVASASYDTVHRTVDVVLAPDAEEAFAPVLINGTIIAVVLALLGHPVLHASAVSVDVAGEARVVAFVGSSGMGKSTLATLTCRDGATLFTDDVLRTEIVDDVVLAWPGATATRLRPAAAALAAQAATSVATTADGRTSAAMPLSPDRAVPLAAIVVPQPDRESDVITVRRLDGVRAVLTLAGFPRVLGWRDATTAGQAHRHWGEIARRVPIMTARVPWGPPFDDDLGAALLQEILATAEL